MVIPQNSDNKPRGLFLVKGPFRQIFLGGLIFGGEGGLIHGRIFAF